jgi:hypothetical protein
MGYREQSQRGSGTSESVDNLISSPDSPSNPDLVAPNTLSTHTLENQSAEAISIALPKAPDLSDQRIQDPNDPNIFYEPLIVVSLEQIQDKEFIERHKEIRRSYCLKGLDDKSTIDDIASRLSDFAASAQPDFCRIVYDWGVEKHGRESILPTFFKIISRSAVAVELSDFIFSEIQKIEGLNPIYVAEWISLHFYSLNRDSLEKLIRYPMVPKLIEPDIFMKLVVCGHYEKALLLLEAGVRINRKCRESNYSIWRYDSGDTYLVAINHPLDLEHRGKHPLAYLRECLQDDKKIDISLALRREAIEEFSTVHGDKENCEPPSSELSQITQVINKQVDETKALEEFDREQDLDNAAQLPLSYFLVVESGPKAFIGDEWELEFPENIFGRAENVDLLFNFSGISRRHFKIIIKDNTPYIMDLNSTNKTRLNNITIPPNTTIQLKAEDKIRVENLTLRLICRPIELARHGHVASA